MRWRSAVRTGLVFLTDHLPARAIRGPDGAVFLERYHLAAIAGRELVIHRFVASDPDRGFHDHPWRRAASLILAGAYEELRTPRADAPPSARTRRRIGAGSINILRGFHRVLVAPGGDAWTVFATGKRIKPWGFLARPGAHRYARDIDPRDHYERRGVTTTAAPPGDDFTAPLLEYRPFTNAIESPDPTWYRRAPTGKTLRARGDAWATPHPPIVPPTTRVILLAGKSGAGKDFVADLLRDAAGARVERIGDATKLAYAARTGVDTRTDRALKETHRAALTALYEARANLDRHFELDALALRLRADPPALLVIADVRMRYELAYLRERIANLTYVRITRRQRSTTADPTHATETDLDRTTPDLVFANDADGVAATLAALRAHGVIP